MRRILLGVMAAMTMLATSCVKSYDDIGAVAGETSKVSVNLGFPAIQTRAYSDGTTATQLQYAVYEVKDNVLTKLDIYTVTDEEIHISKKIDFQLVTGRTYTFVFWAASENAPYTVKFDETGATMTADYSSAKANDENLDAFFASVQGKTITGDVEMSVELTRPFAQINVGTNDFDIAEEMKAAPNRSAIVIKNAYTTLDLVSGKVGDAKKVTFDFGVIPDASYNGEDAPAQTFPVPGYDYLAMAYMLADADEEVVEVQFQYVKDQLADTRVSRTVGSVPVKRNHRTNMYGQVLTSTASLNITIAPEYEEPDYNYSQLLFAAAVGGSVTLTDNVKVPGELTFTKDAVVDLGGHEIKAEGGNYGDAIVIGNGANVTIKNGILNPSASASESNSSATVMVKTSYETHLTLENVAVHGKPYGVYLNNSNEATTVTIKSGTFTTESEKNNGPAVYIQKQGKVTIEGGTFGTQGVTNDYLLNLLDAIRTPNTNKKPIEFIEVRGGTFHGFNPADNKAEGEHTNFVAPGYKSVETSEGSNTWVVVPEDNTVVADSQSLLKALTDGATTISLMPGEYTFEKPLYDAGNQRFSNQFTPEVTIDATGATFVGNYSPNFHGATIKGVTFKNSADANAIFGSFNGNFINCTFDGGVNTESVGNKSSFKDCKFICNAETGRMAFHIGLLNADNTITLENCIIDGRCDFGGDGTIEFKNCIINITQSWGLYANITCDFTGSNITYADGTTIEKKSESATIKGL